MASSLSSNGQKLQALIEEMKQKGKIQTGDALPPSPVLAKQLGLSTKKVVMAALELDIAEAVENVNRRFYLGSAPPHSRNAQQVLLAFLAAISSQRLTPEKKLPSAPEVSAMFGLSLSSYYEQVLGRLANWEIVILNEKRPAVLAPGCQALAESQRQMFRFSKLTHLALAEGVMHRLVTDINGRHSTFEAWRRQETDWDNRQLATRIFDRFGILEPRKRPNSPLVLSQVSPATFAQQAADCLQWVNRQYRLVTGDIRRLSA